ncbi:STAS domain-containing protein [Streptomyces sp. YC504]|uniref:STAS domain-containing protein n=1 Tax=Streptomyces mesophilus TaxID=1775132 RepID=A0A6G4X9X5_9ACTN|nr:STAS domain-containing protein [Streptomyces mesophilus]NGO74346.1 STAS domain-containing protein [Streptomyces mesophilus]
MSPREDATRERLHDALRERHEEIADRWVRLQLEQTDAVDLDEGQLRTEAGQLLAALTDGLSGETPVRHLFASHRDLRACVMELSLHRARAGASPTDTSLAVLCLKEALLEAMQYTTRDTAELFAAAVLINRLLDTAGALSFETYVEGREEIIRRQSRQLLEVSTPVVRLWRHVLAVPLIGTLDTARTQVVMESVLQAIQEHEAQVAIIDITGVPAVDTAVAQHLMHTVNAVRLMGADCVISGIRPPIAQTIAQLGIDLSTILTKATLADALAAAVRITDEPMPGADAHLTAAAR